MALSITDPDISDLSWAVRMSAALGQATESAYNALTADDPTLTAAQMVNGVVKVSGQTTAQGVTTPTATLLLAALPDAKVGTSFDFVLQNANSSSGEATIVAGEGVTLVGTTIVPITKTQLYKGIVTAVSTPAVSLIGLLTAPV